MSTSIEWTDKTWNPVTGCDKVSPGCKNCYAEGIADRFFAKQYPPNADGSLRKFTDVRCHPGRLEEPLKWKKPCRVFVNSMSDLFHEDVSADFILAVFATMAQAKRHTFQILTKRPARMMDVLTGWQSEGLTLREGVRSQLPNVWLGVSVESQKYANERIPWLLQTPAAVRFLSVEPMLEEVDLTQPTFPDEVDGPRGNCLRGMPMHGMAWAKIDWVICGGESGPKARPFNLAWAESLLQQCKGAGVPFFMKQMGSYVIQNGERRKKKDRKGGDMHEWPHELRVREFPLGAL